MAFDVEGYGKALEELGRDPTIPEMFALARQYGGGSREFEALWDAYVSHKREAAKRRARSWSPGDRVPFGFMECDGAKPDGGAGRHVRLVGPSGFVAEDPASGGQPRHPLREPELQPDEEIMWSIGSRVPRIINRSILPPRSLPPLCAAGDR